jgi:hypothetical protein
MRYHEDMEERNMRVHLTLYILKSFNVCIDFVHFCVYFSSHVIRITLMKYLEGDVEMIYHESMYGEEYEGSFNIVYI